MRSCSCLRDSGLAEDDSNGRGYTGDKDILESGRLRRLEDDAVAAEVNNQTLLKRPATEYNLRRPSL